VLGWLLSDEAQTELSRRGLASALRDQTINGWFGEASGRFNGKNVPAFFASTAHAAPDPAFDFRIRYALASVPDHLYTENETTRNLYIGALPDKINESIAAGRREAETASSG
jgi:hypothetical protein